MLPLSVFASVLLASQLATDFVHGKFIRCDVSGAVMDLPPNQSQLVTPPGEKPMYIALGVGVQNYTCSSTGTFSFVDDFSRSCIYLSDHL